MLERHRAILFAALCIGALAALLYFAQSAATESAPAYSTWNTSPQGAELLFDGLKEAGFVQVARQFKPVSIQKPQGATVFFLGVPAFALNYEDANYFDEMEAAARGGNNLVIAIPDESAYTFKKDEKKTMLETRWGIRFASDKGIFSASPLMDKSWQAVDEDVWQKAVGKGFLTVIGKGQRFDNKGIASDEANRALLYQLVSAYPQVIFEEAHLGIRESGSIVGLARHYHLQGLMAGLLVLAALFVWSRSVSFPPPAPVQEKTLMGSDTRAVLTELMSRHLKNELMATCVAEWNRTRGAATALSLSDDTNAVEAYARLQQGLQNRQTFKL